MNIIGISAYCYDSSAVLICNGKIVAAVEEERFTRKKHENNIPIHAINHCISLLNHDWSQVDFVSLYDVSNFGDSVQQALARHFPAFDWENRFQSCPVDLAQAASAFFPSPFEHAAIVILDGVGTQSLSCLACGDGENLDIVDSFSAQHSLGTFYAAFTEYTGFKVNSGEYKMMGLAPYGKPKYANIILEEILKINNDGHYLLETSFFDISENSVKSNPHFWSLFGMTPRLAGSPLTDFYQDIAASAQYAAERAILALVTAVQRRLSARFLCLGGRVALNCVANGRVLRERVFERLWIQPASGNAAGAIGAALLGAEGGRGFGTATGRSAHMPRSIRAKDTIPANRLAGDGMAGAYLGPSWEQHDIEARLTALGARYSVFDRAEILDKTATALASGQVIGWIQGAMEFGPRALGNRSILADPRGDRMQAILNSKIKFREDFRPFAPAILAEEAGKWFDLDQDSPYMLLVAPVLAQNFGPDGRSAVPAVTHVDGSARIQTVHAHLNPLFYDLLQSFKAKTGCPILVNTSFNVRGEPMVCSPEDGFRCFMGSGLDVLVIGGCYLVKDQQTAALAQMYQDLFEPD
jgi:carbamoyltransferase